MEIMTTSAITIHVKSIVPFKVKTPCCQKIMLSGLIRIPYLKNETLPILFIMMKRIIINAVRVTKKAMVLLSRTNHIPIMARMRRKIKLKNQKVWGRD
jgi:hypothetical protein